MMLAVLSIAVLMGAAQAALPHYKVGYTTRKCSSLDSTSRTMDVWYPTTGTNHPLVAYAHGNSGGGSLLPYYYSTVNRALAGAGYIVVAPRSCNTGCKDDKTSLPYCPPRFGHYYYELGKSIDCATAFQQSGDKVFKNLDLSIGVGVAGHSMGGQASILAAAANKTYAEKYNIKAAVPQHAYTHTYPASSVPMMLMTGSSDYIASPSMSKKTHNNNVAGGQTTLYAVKSGASHLLPNGSGSSARKMGEFTAAWMKLHVNNVTSELGVDYNEMIFGKSSKSICGGGNGKMTKCTTKKA